MVDHLKENVDNWLNINNPFEGDTICIHGSMEPEVKFSTAKSFTLSLHRTSTDTVFPRILVATEGCIGAGLDSDSVHLIVHIGFPLSIMDLMQEMVRCGRG